MLFVTACHGSSSLLLLTIVGAAVAAQLSLSFLFPSGCVHDVVAHGRARDGR